MSATVADDKTVLLQRLRAAGLRPTVARIAVLQALEACAPERLDAEGVFHSLLRRGTCTSLGTVYRALKDFVDRDLVSQEWWSSGLVGGGKAVYGLRLQGTKVGDIRIVCKQCGCSVDVQDSALREELRQLAESRGLKLTELPMTAVAVCARCVRT